MLSRPLTKTALTSAIDTTTKKQLKRPATTITTETKPSTSKITRFVPIKLIKPVTILPKKPQVVEKKPTATAKNANRPKAAPYDYKTRFNYLKEDFDKFKIENRNLKEKHITIEDQNEVLYTKNEILENEIDTLKLNYQSTKKKLDNIESMYNTIVDVNKNLQTENEKLHEDLNGITNHLKVKSSKLEVVHNEFEEMKKILNYKNRILEENKVLMETMKKQLITFERKQREIQNTILGNIRVFCRIRPPLIEEKHKILYNVNYVDEKTIELLKNDKISEFGFDKVFGPNAMQEEIFDELSQLVQSALDGYNVCIFAYGQTGSGKTYTMDGIKSSNQLGIIPRSVDLIFSVIEQLQKLGWNYFVKACFLEIYNENIIDLLDPGKTQLDIRMVDSKSNDVYVANLSVIKVQIAEDLKYLLHQAQKNRAKSNERSSRSHSVTKIILEGFNKDSNERCAGSLNLVDLAGSEKLSNLNNVILALLQKTTHVPYRNSKLFTLLMPCLGGNSKTLMLVNISPLDDCYNESVNSLNFATTVNQCKNGSIKKIKSLLLNGLRSENFFTK